MLNQRILEYIFILIISLLLCSLNVHAQINQSDTGLVAIDSSLVQADSTLMKDTVKPNIPKKDNSGRHLSFGIDIFHPVLNQYITNEKGYEFTLDYYTKRDIYLAADAGWGSSNVNYPDLKYATDNKFFRFGVNRSLLLRKDSADWNNLFIGFRLGGANVNRTQASYIVIDSLWGSTLGIEPAKNFMAYWIELTMGVRVQIVKDISMGWNVRAKFLLNGKSFLDLAPLYIAGYGRGDKNSVFDYNLYLYYSISWKRKNQRLPPVIPEKKIETEPKR